MTKISKKSAYPVKIPVRKDYFVGTDSDNNGKTVNFDFESTAKLINELNGTPILNYIFKTDNNIPLAVLTDGVFLSEGNETTIANISKLYINKKNFHEENMSDLFRFIAVNREVFVMKLRNSSNLANGVYFKITDATEFQDHFILDVAIELSNTAVPELVNFNVYFFDFELASSGEAIDLSGYATKAYVDEKDVLLENRITELEGSKVLYNRFTGKSYVIWSGTGLTYDVVYTSYYLENILYPGGTVQKTLATSDPTNPRFDLIKVNNTGVIVATGTPSASPEVPSADPNTELAISSVLVEAGSTVPSNVSIEDVYKENSEWTAVSNNGTVNFNATTIPFQGTKHIDCGSFSNGQYLRFTDTVLNQVTDFSLLKFYVNLKATFANTAKFSIKFYNGSTLISSIVTVASGNYNFERTIVNTYQTVIVPLSDFTFSSSSFDRIEIVMIGANASGFRMDNISLAQGVGSSSTEQNAITSIITDSGIANANTKDDTFQFKGANGLLVSAIGKIITFTSNFTTALKNNYDSAYTWVQSHQNVDNTSDVDKPVSTAQANALDLKLNITDYNNHFKSVYLTEAALFSAHPTASVGDYAQVNEVGATDVVNYNWDAEENIWVKNAVAGSGATNTDELPEGTANLYFTVTRFLANLTYANVIAALGFTPSTAPNNAQKNSDITKAEIEAKLTGEITSHTHPNSGGGGDMTTTTDQTVSGIKTFLAGKFGFRNVANTFTSFFTNANTASRTYTFQNKDYTVADNADLAGKMANPTGGIVNYLPKFLTAATMGLSRLWDTGTFFGIGTLNAPTKDLTFGNQASREIGIEQSSNSIPGQNLIVSAGRTINFIPTVGFVVLVNTSTLLMWSVQEDSNGDVFVSLSDGSIYVKYSGTSVFVFFSGSEGMINGKLVIHTNGDRYLVGALIKKQTGGTGSWVTIATGDYQDVAIAPNGDVWACGTTAVYKQTGGTGSFVNQGFTVRDYRAIAVDASNKIYVGVNGATGGLYEIVSGVMTFLTIGDGYWNSIKVAPNTNVYAISGASATLFTRTSGTGSFASTLGALPVSGGNRGAIGVNSDSSIYYVHSQSSYNVYFKNNNNVGPPNLDGGYCILKAGTGKGIGKSLWQAWTGQKTASGTDMQVEALRIEIDEDGNVMLMTSKVFADNAAAIAGGLPLKTIYWTATGEMRMVV